MRQRYHGRSKAFLAAAAMAAAVLGWRWWRPFIIAVEGDSMAPVLRPGDFLVAVRPRPGGLRPGAVIIVERPGRPGFEMIKRLAGMPGERVEGARVLGPGEYWVLGDRLDRSTDSRSFGPVGAAAIRGVVQLCYWPPDRLGPVP